MYVTEVREGRTKVNGKSVCQRGHSSAGRAPALQAGGRRFDPDWLHHSDFRKLMDGHKQRLFIHEFLTL